MFGRELELEHRGRRARVVSDGETMDGVIDFMFSQRGDEPEENVWLLETSGGPESIGADDSLTFLD